MTLDQQEVLINGAMQCNLCIHRIVGTATCTAFPDKIPAAILAGHHDHTKPFPGDKGVRFERIND